MIWSSSLQNSTIFKLKVMGDRVFGIRKLNQILLDKINILNIRTSQVYSLLFELRVNISDVGNVF